MVVRALGTTCIIVSAMAVALGPGVAAARSNAEGITGDAYRPAPRGKRPMALDAESASPFPAQVTPWGEMAMPSTGPALVYGTTTSGCLAGAMALPARGLGFVRRRPWRRTGFGHPDLVEYVVRLGQASRRAGLGALVIGDMSLPRGGAYLHGHTSHQTGLDVDIAYKTLAAPLDVAAGAAWQLPLTAAALATRGDKRLEALLRLAAADEHVDRIFVAAGLKQRLCRTVDGDRGFLDVLRPWLGHEQHFHVRLKCPTESPDCRPNEPVTTIPDSCDALARWWRGAHVQSAFAAWRASERTSRARDLPRACGALAPAVGKATVAKVAPAEPHAASGTPPN